MNTEIIVKLVLREETDLRKHKHTNMATQSSAFSPSTVAWCAFYGLRNPNSSVQLSRAIKRDRGGKEEAIFTNNWCSVHATDGGAIKICSFFLSQPAILSSTYLDDEKANEVRGKRTKTTSSINPLQWGRLGKKKRRYRPMKERSLRMGFFYLVYKGRQLGAIKFRFSLFTAEIII